MLDVTRESIPGTNLSEFIGCIPLGVKECIPLEVTGCIAVGCRSLGEPSRGVNEVVGEVGSGVTKYSSLRLRPVGRLCCVFPVAMALSTSCPLCTRSVNASRIEHVWQKRFLTTIASSRASFQNVQVTSLIYSK